MDWGHQAHAFALQAAAGPTEAGTLPQTAEALHAWLHDLEQHFGARPVALALKATRPRTLKQFYSAHHLRRPVLLAVHRQRVRDAVAGTTEETRISVAVLQLHCLLDQLRAWRNYLARFDQQIQTVFAAHSEASLFRNPPGTGVASVREKSGQLLGTHWRRPAPVFLHQTRVEWAGQSVQDSAWTRASYQRMTAKGKGRHTILRGAGHQMDSLRSHKSVVFEKAAGIS